MFLLSKGSFYVEIQTNELASGTVIKRVGVGKQSLQLAAALKPAPNWNQMLLTFPLLCCHSFMFLLLLSEVSPQRITEWLVLCKCQGTACSIVECSLRALLVSPPSVNNLSSRFSTQIHLVRDDAANTQPPSNETSDSNKVLVKTFVSYLHFLSVK